MGANDDDRTIGICRGCLESKPLLGWLGYCAECSTALEQFFVRRRLAAADRKKVAEEQRIQKEAANGGS